MSDNKEATDVREYPSRPFIGVGVVVLKEEMALLIRRGKPPKQGEWSLPGGSQNVGETVRETAAREVREETGVEIKEAHFLEVIDAIIPDRDGRTKYHYTLIDFVAEWAAGEAVAADDAEHAEWVSLNRLDELELWEKTRRVIRKAARLRELGYPAEP